MKWNYSFLLIICLLAGCDLTDSNQATEVSTDLNVLPTSDPSPTTSTQRVNWEVALLVEDGLDLTRNFEGISISFSTGGLLEAEKNGQKITGSWKLERDFPSDELYLDFPQGTVLEELDEDWYVVERTETKLVMEDEYDGKKDHLILVSGQPRSAVPSPFSGRRQETDALFLRLDSSSFTVDRLIDHQRDKSALFTGSELVLSSFGIIELRRFSQVLAKGVWYIGFNDKEIKLDFNLPGVGISEYLDEEWLFQTKTNQLIQLIESDDLREDRLDLRVK